MIGIKDDAVETKLSRTLKNEFTESETTDDEDVKEPTKDKVCTKHNSRKKSITISIALIKGFLTLKKYKGCSTTVWSRSGNDISDLLHNFYTEVPVEKYIPNFFRFFFTFSSHTEYVKRESIVCLRRQNTQKKIPSVCLCLWLYVRGLSMWTQ